MGLFSKIKNILFEEDDEVEEMPVYTKEEVKETPKKDVEEKPMPDIEEPIKATNNSRFRNVKRDIDLNFDENDVLGEIPGASDVVNREERLEPEAPVKREEKKSPFLSFDEDEFERLNSRINSNESRVRKEVKSVGMPANSARKANNNFSATSTNKETRIDNVEKYKINSNLNGGKKPFTPSPVISPVYGILDKNYKKDDIVDKQGGMKREKIVKPVVRKEVVKEEPKQETKKEVFDVDIDKVRRKAYGELEELEKNIETPVLKVDKKVDLDKKEEFKILDVEDTDIDMIPKKVEEPSIEEQLEDNFVVTEPVNDEVNDKLELDDVVEKVIEDKPQLEQDNQNKARMLNELEKTSTLQILDDIEKELNSIKPITNNSLEEKEDEESTKKKIDNSDTLENDLFNLIDSMYEEGEEEEDD